MKATNYMELNVLSFSTFIDDNFRNFWATQTVHHVEITTTWAGDLAIALYYAKKENNPSVITKMVKEAIEDWTGDFTFIGQLLMAAHYLAEFCYCTQEFKEYTNIFLNAINLLETDVDTKFTEEDQLKLYQILD